MSSGALLNIMDALEEYVANEMKFYNQSEFFRARRELYDSGLDVDEADMMLMYTSIINKFLSEMNEVLEIFKKVAKFREDRAKKTKLLETKKELEEAQAIVATKLTELEEAQAIIATKLAELEEAQAIVATKLAELEEAHAIVATKLAELAELEKLGGP
jgi:hypothetical protein